MNTLIAKYLRGELSDSERKELDGWLSEDPINQSVTNEIQLIWEQCGYIRKGYKPVTEEAWQRLSEKISHPEKKHVELYRWMSGVAASVILVGLLTFLYVRDNRSLDYETMTDVKSSIELPDGSVVWINKNSELSFEDSKDSRSVTLNGEAFFDVAKNPDKPFIIQTGELKTQVIGTSFNVNASIKGSVDVIVASGKVLVFSEKDSVFLDPGEKGVYNQNAESLIEKVNMDLNFNAWKTGILIFDKTPIKEVMMTLEQHFDAKLSCNDSGDVKLTGSFDNISLDEILEIVELTTDVKIIQ